MTTKSKPKTVTIIVSRVGNSKKLYFSDSEGHTGIDDEMITNVNSGDTIIWKLKTDDKGNNISGLGDLYSLKVDGEETGEKPSFGTLELVIGGDGTYQATNKYEIGYYDDKGTIHWEDPKLKLNF